MSEFYAVNLALPGASLLKSDEPDKLAFESTSWVHLNRYVNLLQNLSLPFEGTSEETGKVLERLQSQARGFGSPKALRELLIKNPNVLAGGPTPAMLYAAIASMTQGLHQAAFSTVSTLQSLGDFEPSAGMAKAAMQMLEETSQKAQTTIAPLVDSLRGLKAWMQAANSELASAYQADAKVLQEMQERIGALGAIVQNLQKKISGLGIFSGKKERQELEDELQAAQTELAQKSAAADKLRASLSQIEPVLTEGHWLDSGIADLMDFMEKSRRVWATLRDGASSLASEASDAQLADANWLKNTLGLDEAIKQWTAIDSAAKRFATSALVDTASA